MTCSRAASDFQTLIMSLLCPPAPCRSKIAARGACESGEESAYSYVLPLQLTCLVWSDRWMREAYPPERADRDPHCVRR